MTLRDKMDNADLNTLADMFRSPKAPIKGQGVAIGQTLQQDVKQTYRKQNPDEAGASPYELATLDAIVLPDESKASTLLRIYARAGTAGTGEMTQVGPGSTPLTGQVAVSAAGNIVFLAADAITDVDFEYLPQRGDVREFTGTVTANVLTLPVQLTSVGVVMMMEAEALEAGATGAKIVLVPGAGAPAAGQARLDIAKATVTFAGADAVTRARVKLLLVAEADLSALLSSSTPIL